MKTPIIKRTIIALLSVCSVAVAQDQAAPGKSSDSVVNPASGPSGRAAATESQPAKEPGKSSDSVKEPDATKASSAFSGSVEAVNKVTKTITVNDSTKGAHKLHLSEKTKVTKDGKEASWEDIKVGAKIKGTCQGGKDSAHAETITIN